MEIKFVSPESEYEFIVDGYVWGEFMIANNN
jgi:hypothetical protein